MNFQRQLTLRVVLAVFALLTVTIAIGSKVVQAAPEGKVHVFVQWAPGKSAEAKAHLQGNGAEIRYQFDDLESYAVTMPAGRLNSLDNNPNIVSWEEDVERVAYGTNSAAAIAEAIAAAGEPQYVPWGVTRVQATQIWDLNNDGHVDAGALNGAGRTVCIIDTGYYRDHEDLQDTGVNGFSQHAGEDWFEDGNGHGSHVAGTIAGQDNNVGVIGVAPGVNLYIVKFFNNDGVATLASDLVAAADRCAQNGANVISMSLGGGRSSRTERNKFDSLDAQGVLSIAAAGNDGNTATSYPAGYTSVLSVGATDINNNIADFSQQNADVELSAPGVDVDSTVPYIDVARLSVGSAAFDGIPVEFAALGTASGAVADGGLCDATNGSWNGKVVLCSRGVISFFDKTMNVQNSGGVAAVIYNNVPNESLNATLGEGNSSNIPAIGLTMEDGQAALAFVGQNGTVETSHTAPVSGYAHYNGTSMATPHVSAVAALVWSQNPAWTNDQIREALTATALDLGTAGRDNTFGYGLVQAKAALDYALANFGGDPDPDPGSINLSVNAYKSKGEKYADLSWSGATSANVDIYRNGVKISTTANDGAHTDGPLGKGGGSATYKVCEAGTTTCSADVNVSW